MSEMSVDPAVPPPPDWLLRLAGNVGPELANSLTRPVGVAANVRPAAVLILFGDGPRGPDVLLLERSAELRNHASQPAFPGGGADPTDASRVQTALREAKEEVGLDATGVDILAVSEPLYLRPSQYLVTPVIGWWHTPCAVAPVDPGETSSVARVPLAELADPANRIMLRHPNGYAGPAFRVSGMLVWGFTAGILATLLRLGGWERPWNDGHVVDDPVTQTARSAAGVVPGPRPPAPCPRDERHLR